MEELKSILSNLSDVHGILSAIVISRDGFVLDAVVAPDTDAEPIAAIISSEIGSCESIGRELEIGEFQHCMFEYSGGIVMTSMLSTDAILAVIADHGTNLGNLRMKMKQAVPSILESL